MKDKRTTVRMFPGSKTGRKPWQVMDSTSKSGLTDSTKGAGASSSEAPRSARIESSLNFLCHLGWFLGLFPRNPSKLESFKIRSLSFFLYVSYTTTFLVLLNFVKSAMMLQVISTNFDSHADKLALILREAASSISDFFIRAGLLIRAESAVRLLQNIQDYNSQYSRLPKAKGRHKGMKYLAVCSINLVYLSWLMGVTVRRIKLSSNTFSSILETKMTIFPSFSGYDEGNINILDSVCFISSVLSSYYLSILIILVAHVLLEFLEDFYEKLHDNLSTEGKILLEQTTPYSSLPRSQSDLSAFFLNENGKDSILSEKNRNEMHYFHQAPPSVVTQAQFTELSRLFEYFNRTIGISLVASVFADILMIITIIYTLFVDSSAVSTSNRKTSTMASCTMADTSGCTFTSFTNMLILASEAEYECKIFIMAAIGSYLTYKITHAKTRLQELTYSFEGFSESVFCTRAGGICKRFLLWQWVLRGMDIFNVNLRLLPTVLATVTTYVIVLLQVRMSELPCRGSGGGFANHT